MFSFDSQSGTITVQAGNDGGTMINCYGNNWCQVTYTDGQTVVTPFCTTVFSIVCRHLQYIIHLP